MRHKIYQHKLIFTLSCLAIIGAVIVAGILVWRQSLANSQLAITPQLTPKFLLASNTQIVQTNTLLNPDSIAKTFDYNEVLAFTDGKAVVTKQDVIYYLEFDHKGEISHQVQIGVRPDLVLSMARQLLIDNQDTYFVYVIPLRGIRLFHIAADDKVSENYFPINEFFKLYSDNNLFISEHKLYIPDGDLKLYTIDLVTSALATEVIDSRSCGAGSWQINHNQAELFVLTTSLQVCIFNVAEHKAVHTLDLAANLWFKLIPDQNLLITEKWEMLNSFPSSSGELAFYDLSSGNKIGALGLHDNADFVAQRAASPGGYSLIGDYYDFAPLHQLYLFTRAGTKNYVLKLDADYKFVEFSQVGDFNFGSSSQINGQ